MTTAFQLALFCRYDLLIELDWRRKLAEEEFFDLKTKGMSLGECIDGALLNSELCPLELSQRRDRLLVEADGVNQDTGERIFCFTAHHQFAGDEQLWHMNPGIHDNFPDGETFRLDLIVALLAASHEEFEARMGHHLRRICGLIDKQTQRISAFMDSLPPYLEALSTDSGRGTRRYH